MVSGLMFADDFVGISGTAEGLQEQIEKALEYTRKWRVTANVNKCAVLVCNEDGKKPVELKWKWGCLLYTSPSPRDLSTSRMPSSA